MWQVTLFHEQGAVSFTYSRS